MLRQGPNRTGAQVIVMIMRNEDGVEERKIA
jgi:hypothetical protein